MDGLGSLFGGDDTPTSDPNENPLGGIGGILSGVLGGGTTTTPTSSRSPTSSSTSSTPSTSTTSQISSSSSTPVPSTSTHSTTSTSVSTPTSTPIPTPTPTTTSTPSLTPTPTPTPTPASSASLIVLTSTSGTSVVYVTSIESNPASATGAAAPESFLQNKPLEGGVFALVAIVIMIIIFVVITYTIRRRQRNRLENDVADAITFDPTVAQHYGDEENGMNAFEKTRLSGSSTGHGHGFGYGCQPVYAPPAVPQYGYYGSQGYEQQAAAYHVPPTQGPVYNLGSAVNTGGTANTGNSGVANTGSAVDLGSAADTVVAVNTGGANLTRKYSDRKPVPPLLPNPVYDPTQSPVLPSHYYMQNQGTPVSPISQSMSLSIPPGALTTPALHDNSEDDPYTGMLEVVNR